MTRNINLTHSFPLGLTTYRPSQLEEHLHGEEEASLMQRNYCYWEESSQSWHTSTVQKLKDAGLKQLKKCLCVVRQGIVHSGSAGILDWCICCVEGDSCLDGYVIMCTRVFGWKAETVQTKWIYWGA